MMILKSTSDLLDAHGRLAVSSKGSNPAQESRHVLMVENSILLVRQMREVHEEINDLLIKLTTGTRPVNPNYGGGQQGGFGGGFFNVR